jgi:membrane-associated phospholipid phosphatase
MNRSEMMSHVRLAVAVTIVVLAGASQARAGQVVTEIDPAAGAGAAVLIAAAHPCAGIAQAVAQTTPEPSHSGFKALVKETAIDFAAFPRRRSTWAILAIGGVAAAAAHPADDYVTEHIVGSKAAERTFVAGKWLGSVYVQSGTAVGLYLVGRYAMAPAADGSRTNKVSHLGFDLIRAQIVSQALVHAIKYTVQRDRPTGECCAFPSGHAATAFAAASVIERHFGMRAAWPTLAAASYVAASRLIDNRHFLSDVMFGSAVGMASGWTVVGRHGRSTFALAPTPVRGGMMVALVKLPATDGEVAWRHSTHDTNWPPLGRR